MQTVLEVILVNVKEGVAKSTLKPYKICEAHCVLRDETGKAGAVGVLNLPKDLESITPGVYMASFGMEAPTFGDSAGKIIAVLKTLVPFKAPAAVRQVA